MLDSYVLDYMTIPEIHKKKNCRKKYLSYKIVSMGTPSTYMQIIPPHYL